MTFSSCRERIDRFLQRDLAHWTGLDAVCPKADVTQLPFEEGEGVARLGTRNVEYPFRVLRQPGFTEGVFFYFDRETVSVITTDYWSFDADQCSALLAQLGEPAHRLDFNWRERRIDGGEWVYPERGIAVGVLPETGLIARVVGYPPCPLETYRDRYYKAEPAREFRGRE